MHFFNLIAIFGLVAFAAAAPQVSDSPSSIAPSSTSASSSAIDTAISTVPVSPTTRCIDACGTDLCCKAACVGVPCPSQAQANATTECAMRCDQGNGSPADAEAYGACQSSCISSLFFTSTGAAAATGTNSRPASNSASATSSASSARQSASSAGSSSASAGSSTASAASAASASPTGNAASGFRMGASTANLLGLLMAALAL